MHECEKKKLNVGGGVSEEEGGGAGEPIVDMLMLLTISTAIKMS